MKTKDFIKMLQDADPTGDMQVCVDNEDIHFVEPKSAYWDGILQVLLRDKSREGSYNIEGVSFQASGAKLEVHTLGFQDVLLDEPDAKMEYETEYAQNKMQEIVEKERNIVKKLIADLDARDKL